MTIAKRYRPRELEAFVFTQRMADGLESVPYAGLTKMDWGYVIYKQKSHFNVNVGNYVIVQDGRCTAVEEAWRFHELYEEVKA